MKIKKQDNGAALLSNDAIVEKMDATELLAFSDQLKEFVLDNAESFTEPPLKEVSFRNRSFHVEVTDKLWFWEELESGKWESDTFDVFDRFLDKDTVFLDIGGWIGSTFLYASQLVKKSIVFEPDEVAFKELSSNLSQNESAPWYSHTEVIQAAIAPESGSVSIGFRHESGDSMSSVLLGNAEGSTKVQSVNLSDFISERGLTDEKLFVKMDVEGFEYEILPALGYTIQSLPNANFLISLHPQFLLEKLSAEIPSGKLKTSLIRKAFFAKHQALLKAFKGYKCSFINGKPFNPRKELTKALITGQFSRDLVFTR
ncbi:FkbM family methyltransferase [Cryomorphaceae bacterium 1068]|nr:FkbM family methyltransferase [Cryomorphaceae bacterium 1068]